MGRARQVRRREGGTTAWLTRLAVAGLVCLAVAMAVLAWSPGADITDGRHDLGRNGIWLQHGWLGDDAWFERNGKQDLIATFRSNEATRKLAAHLRAHGMADVFPHLCPTQISGEIAPLDDAQTRRFLESFDGFRVMPWVGGVWGKQAFPEDAAWRARFAASIADLFSRHPDFAGVHLNIEPCPTGNEEFLFLLDDVRRVLPQGKRLSVAAFPPPTRFHPFPAVHWTQDYYGDVARRSDQLVVMMYDTALPSQKLYRHLMTGWTRDILEWSEGAEVLLGLPAYDDAGVGYHRPRVENLLNALSGVHAGLAGFSKPPSTYAGIAVYSEWEMDDHEWAWLRRSFLRGD